MRSIFFALIGFWLCLSSCEDTFTAVVPIDPPAYDPQLVFHIRLNNRDSNIRLVLSRNIGILDNFDSDTQWQVRNANVEWWQNGQKVLTLNPVSADSSFVYSGVFAQPPQAGQSYEIRATHPNFDPVVARQTMPTAVNADSAKIKRGVSNSQFSGLLHQIEIAINDTPGEVDYYEIAIQGQQFFLDYQFNPDGTFTVDTLGSYLYSSYFDNFFDQNVVRGTNNVALVSDQFFDGQRYKFIAQFAPSSYSSTGDENTYILNIRKVTKEHYLWSRSYQQRYESDFNIFAEPVPVFNNLENGLGIFSLSNGKDFELK